MNHTTVQFQTIEFSQAQGVARVVLNRPDSLNSFSLQMHQELRTAIKQVQQDAAIRVMFITGAGRAFCAGQDLKERKFQPGDPAPDLGASIDKHYNPLIRSLRALEKPVVCAVNGVAAGAGANLALACDLVFAARSASFIQAFCRIGLVPDCGGTWQLPHRIGSARALGLALTGHKLPAEHAEQWGLIWRCVDDDQLQQQAYDCALQLAQQPTYALGLIKRAINAAASNSLDQQLDLERDLQRLAGRSKDYQEGVNAFVEKRAPNFKGF